MTSPTFSSRQDGFTLIELVIAMAVALVGLGAITIGLVGASNSVSAGNHQAQLVSIVQSQLEAVRQDEAVYGFADMFLNAPPGSRDASVPTNPTNPNDYVNPTPSPSTFWIEENYNNNTGSPSANVAAGTPSIGEPLITGTGTASLPGVQQVNRTVPAGGGGTATVYTFITQVYEACNAALAGTGGGNCTAAAQDERRVIVAAVYNNATEQTPTAPQWATTIIDNPVPSNQVNVGNGLHLGLNVGGIAIVN